ncbi:MAG: hypothetical protein JNK64_25295 [Myxococcales bacterium]|nr:hypothetical protein [Myxococcales bacterium]
MAGLDRAERVLCFGTFSKVSQRYYGRLHAELAAQLERELRARLATAAARG